MQQTRYDQDWRNMMMKSSLKDLRMLLSKNKRDFATKHNLKKAEVITLIRLGAIVSQE